MDAEPSKPKPRVQTWREASRTERVAGLVFFGSLWVLSVVLGANSTAEVVGVVAWGLALVLGAPMAFSNSAMVWRFCRWPTIVLVAVGLVLLFVPGF